MYQLAVAEGAIQPGIAADNCVAAHYEGTDVAEFISSTSTARAYRVEQADTGFSETEIVPRFLGV